MRIHLFNICVVTSQLTVTGGKKMSIELEFKVASFRKIPSPYFSEVDNSPEMYT